MIKKSDNYEMSPRKQGRRRVGDLVSFEGDKKAYIKLFSQRDIFRDGEKTISTALRKGKGCLWMETHELMELKFSDVEYVGFQERNIGDIYLTRLSTFFSGKTSKSVRVGARDVKAVPLNVFHVRYGTGKLKLPTQSK